MRFSFELLLILSPVLVTLAALYGLWLSEGKAAEDLAGWVEAVATTMTLAVAGAAALYAKGAFDLEQEREGRRLEADSQAQAVLVAAWPGTDVVDRKSLPNDHPLALGEGEFIYRETGKGVEVAGVWIRNASPLPVLDAIADVTMTARLPGTFEEAKPWMVDLGLVPPAERPVFIPFRADFEAVRANSAAQWTRDGYEVGYEVGIRFRDGAGNYWRRTRDGGLLPDGRHGSFRS